LAHSPSACIRYCSVAAAAVILTAAFQWSIIDVVTPFLFLPLQGAAWLLLLAGFFWAVIVQARSRFRGRATSYPLLICAAGTVLALSLPWTTIWLAANERVYRTDRERIVRQVQDGSLRPNVDYNGALIALGSSSPNVSKGGNEIVVQERGGQRYVFFYTYRGVLDNYAGFLFVPTGGDPRLFAKAAEPSTLVEQRSANWFFVAHR
jgi:hypothetical protein